MLVVCWGCEINGVCDVWGRIMVLVCGCSLYIWFILLVGIRLFNLLYNCNVGVVICFMFWCMFLVDNMCKFFLSVFLVGFGNWVICFLIVLIFCFVVLLFIVWIVKKCFSVFW